MINNNYKNWMEIYYDDGSRDSIPMNGSFFSTSWGSIHDDKRIVKAVFPRNILGNLYVSLKINTEMPEDSIILFKNTATVDGRKDAEKQNRSIEL